VGGIKIICPIKVQLRTGHNFYKNLNWGDEEIMGKRNKIIHEIEKEIGDGIFLLRSKIYTDVLPTERRVTIKSIAERKYSVLSN